MSVHREARNGKSNGSGAAEAPRIIPATIRYNRPLAERILGEKSDKEEVKRRLRPLLEQVKALDPRGPIVLDFEPLNQEGLNRFDNFWNFYARVFLALKIVAVERGVFADLYPLLNSNEILTTLGDVARALDVYGKAIYLVRNSEASRGYPAAQNRSLVLPETGEVYTDIVLFVERYQRRVEEAHAFLFEGSPPGGPNAVFVPTTRERMDAFLSLLEGAPPLASVLASLQFAPGVHPDKQRVFGLSFAFECKDLLDLRGLDRKSFVARKLARELNCSVAHELAHSLFDDSARATGRLHLPRNVDLTELFAVLVEIASGPVPFIGLSKVYVRQLRDPAQYAGSTYNFFLMMANVLYSFGVPPGQEANVLLAMPPDRLAALARIAARPITQECFGTSLEEVVPAKYFEKASLLVEEISGGLIDVA